jgi:hypothetical protein
MRKVLEIEEVTRRKQCRKITMKIENMFTKRKEGKESAKRSRG